MAAQKWAQNLSGATTAIQQGVAGVTTSPTSRAADRADAYAQGVARAVASGKYANNLRAVTLQQWQDAMNKKGIPRIATGAQAAVPKMTSFLNALIPYQMSGLAQLPPRGDFNQNMARMMAWAQYMAAFKKPAGS